MATGSKQRKNFPATKAETMKTRSNLSFLLLLCKLPFVGGDFTFCCVPEHEIDAIVLLCA